MPDPVTGVALRRHLLVFGLVAIAYLAVFAHGIHVASSGLYWRCFDQVDHRLAAADGCVELQRSGLLRFLVSRFEGSPPHGFLHAALGGLAYAVGLDPTFAPFLVFLVTLLVVFLAFTRATGSPWLGWTAVALTTAPMSLQNMVGAATDFRPDFQAQSLWTAAAALTLCSRAFADRRLVLAAGLVLGIVFVSRTLSAVYALTAAPLLVAVAWLGAGHGTRGQRLTNLALGGVIAAVIALPLFLARLDVIWSYYVDNGLSQRENEARGFHGGFRQHFDFYTRSVRKDHLGELAGDAWLVLTGFVMLAGGWRSWRQGALWLTVLAFFSPLLVLSLGPQYSAIVGGIVVGVVMLVPLVPAVAGLVAWRVPRRLALVLLTAALCTWPVRFLIDQYRERAVRLELGDGQAGAMLDTILTATRGRDRVVVSTVPLIEAISAPMLLLLEFERTGQLVRRWQGGLGHTFYRCADAAEFEQKLRASDVVAHWLLAQSHTGLPAEQEAYERRELVERVLAEAFVPAAQGQLRGYPLCLYFRKPD